MRRIFAYFQKVIFKSLIAIDFCVIKNYDKKYFVISITFLFLLFRVSWFNVIRHTCLCKQAILEYKVNNVCEFIFSKKLVGKKYKNLILYR